MKARILTIGLCALLYYSSAFASGSDTTRINALLEQSMRLQLDSRIDSAFILAEQAYQLSIDSKYKTGIGTASQRMGYNNLLKNKQDSSVWFLKQALAIREETKNYKGAIATCLTLKYVYSKSSEYDKAFDILFHALRINNKTGDSSALAEIYMELGNTFIDYKDLKRAKEYLISAEIIAKKINDKQNLIQVTSSLGNFYYNNRDAQKALTYFLQSERLSLTEKVVQMLAPTYNNIALCYEQLKQYNQAALYYKKGLTEYINLGMRFDEGNTYFNLASMYNNRRIPDSAIFYLRKSLEISKEIGDLKHEALCNEYLSDAYAMKKDFESAYSFHLNYSLLSDSLLNEDKVSSIAEMQTKYSTEIKEQQIKLLDRQNKIKSLQRNGLIIGLIAILIFSVIVLRERNKANKERNVSDQLLLNILPSEVAQELKNTGSSEAKQYNHVTVIFTDFVNFTGISEQLSPKELVAEIHKNFSAFDAIIEKHGLEKIKTIGDAYMAVCGLPIETPDHAFKAVKASLEIRDYMAKHSGKFKIRIGVNSGAVVAGIVGVKKYAYDIWGDTVNTASRMESNSESGKVNISASTYELVKEYFTFEHRGWISVKGKGDIEMYFVDGKVVAG